MPPAPTSIMICGAARGTKDAAPSFAEYVIYHLRSALRRRHAPADRRFLYISFETVCGILASSLFGKPKAYQTELARGAAPSNPGSQSQERR